MWSQSAAFIESPVKVEVIYSSHVVIILTYQQESCNGLEDQWLLPNGINCFSENHSKILTVCDLPFQL